jgi:hypothetical protein
VLVTNFNLKYRLYKVILAISQLLDTSRLHPLQALSKIAFKNSVFYIKSHMQNAIGFETQKEILQYSLEQSNLEGFHLEFGVFKGGTIRFMAKKKPHVHFHGFDSFEGLPNTWLGTSLLKGTFSLKGTLPKVPSNVTLHKGWFKDSITSWRKIHKGKIAFIHIDCDLYSSTKDILDNLTDLLQVNTIILFDEYFNYPNWQNHEFKAWQEFVKQNHIQYEYIAFARQQVAVKITHIESGAE